MTYRMLCTLTCLALLTAARSASADDSELSDVQQTAVADVEARTEELADVNHAIWEYAEIGLEEHRSAALLVQKLKDNGFEVETGIAGMPTAFVAEYGSGGPIIGILAEYDALPGLSQKAVPYREPLEEGAPGHACGHSGLGTGAYGAALAVKKAMDEHGLEGTIRLYGTPAEETALGKVYMVLDNVFDDLDVCLHWHPSTKNGAVAGSSKALVSVKFTFDGIAAHGAVSPHDGRSALDAVELMNTGVNFMREHVKEDCRMHYVITDGGGQPNVVPPHATVWYYVRADTHEDVEYYFDWVNDIAEGAARMTRTELTVQIDTDCHELIPNTPLSEAILTNMNAIGAPTFTAEEHAFAARIQEPLTAEFGTAFPATINENILTLAESSETGKGSTDVGDISWLVPTGGVRTACMAAGSPGHSWQNVACIGSSIGEKGIVFAAKVLAVTTIQLLQDEELRVAARADFEERMQDREYTTLIPEGQPVPKKIR
ncbi:MAG: amidohydrolase [Planctomycetota bacterium]|nr:MAG: amidohydrolase [Planctomycetota bacterium]REJ91708.1 MAG: amidohydrolase [Planctomycetota bacterium]REK22840.1 MAG: amidohydrolase [Planctomycetota bacterium]REK32418.1 MAG: amidohydrolase [Planctomycetota bacterium]